jgi:hypothetical protein
MSVKCEREGCRRESEVECRLDPEDEPLNLCYGHAKRLGYCTNCGDFAPIGCVCDLRPICDSVGYEHYRRGGRR